VSLHSNHKIIGAILDRLFGPERRRFKQWVDRLCQQNQALHGRVGFLYEGVHYWPSTITYENKAEKKPVDESLVPEMDSYLKDKAIIDLDEHHVRQCLFNLLFPCDDGQGRRDALPECLVGIVPAFQGMPRNRPEAWSIQENARALRQYQTVLPKIEMYVAARMIY
jgi:hypothetical protein